MNKESIITKQTKKLRQLENMALMLDKACKDGSVVDDDVEKAQDVLNSINEKYQDDNDILGPNGYLIYEVQGLIHWVKGEEKDAKDLIRSAKNIKGDSQLFTDSANDLVGASVKNDKTKKPTSNLTIFILGLLLSGGSTSVGKVIGTNSGVIISGAVGIVGFGLMLVAILDAIFGKSKKNKNS